MQDICCHLSSKIEIGVLKIANLTDNSEFVSLKDPILLIMIYGHIRQNGPKKNKKYCSENFAAATPFCILLSSNEVHHGPQGIGLL